MDIYDMIFSDNSEKKNQNNQNIGDPVEQIVIESLTDLEKKNENLTTESLEAEAIYLAAYIYLKDNYQIDFELDYLSDNLVDRIESENYQIADGVFRYMIKHGKGLYGKSEADYGIDGYKMNIRLCPDYGSYIKNYFIRAHKINAGKEFDHFSSPRNCLWRNGQKISDSPTQRDIYYRIDDSTFELMIPPYNPLVTGRVVSRTYDMIKCQSGDNKRTFVFHYNGSVAPQNLELVEMYRNDKGDLVTYHKN